MDLKYLAQCLSMIARKQWKSLLLSSLSMMTKNSQYLEDRTVLCKHSRLVCSSKQLTDLSVPIRRHFSCCHRVRYFTTYLKSKCPKGKILLSNSVHTQLHMMLYLLLATVQLLKMYYQTFYYYVQIILGFMSMNYMLSVKFTH